MDSGIMRNSESLIRESPDRYKLTRTITAINAGFKDNESGLVIGQCKALVTRSHAPAWECIRRS